VILYENPYQVRPFVALAGEGQKKQSLFSSANQGYFFFRAALILNFIKLRKLKIYF
jgi:hypothetical protein